MSGGESASSALPAFAIGIFMTLSHGRDGLLESRIPLWVFEVLIVGILGPDSCRESLAWGLVFDFSVSGDGIVRQAIGGSDRSGLRRLCVLGY
ncbi:hypothetical protein DY000_02042036 [Brassica cretica]|uniref:NADH:quinone oxidoreductase/Mrp antiporter membrane subunit domain-containing protein n=1 Tax=Brassica cretica TaxID=69181 RepID=A0ABQ7BP38_BRACR|nr:hypothetical protein DY000_02042036 [Brassica cretica]